MKAIFTALSLMSLVSLNGFAAPGKLVPGVYDIDPAHTRVSFLIDHFVISQVEGRFNDVKGTYSLSEKLTDCKIDVTIPTASLDTGVAKRDEHLKSADFLEVSKFPQMTFKSKKCSGSLDNFKVTGDLTIKGVKKEVVLDAKYLGTVVDTWKNTRSAVSAKGKISRKEFNILYDDAIEAGPAVGDEVTINIISEGIHQAKKK